MAISTVVKVGGGLTSIPSALGRVGRALTGLAPRHRFVVIPGGGPFADSVREFDRRFGVGADAAHWMAILAMDQYAWAISAYVEGSRVVADADLIEPALEEGSVPILAPYRWLRANDDLPHSWDVTSDSLAGYLAGMLGALHLVLVKPRAGSLEEVADPYLLRAAPLDLRISVVGVEELQRLPAMLGDGVTTG